jgi:hypothetical protein
MRAGVFHKGLALCRRYVEALGQESGNLIRGLACATLYLLNGYLGTPRAVGELLLRQSKLLAPSL